MNENLIVKTFTIIHTNNGSDINVPTESAIPRRLCSNEDMENEEFQRCFLKASVERMKEEALRHHQDCLLCHRCRRLKASQLVASVKKNSFDRLYGIYIEIVAVPCCSTSSCQFWIRQNLVEIVKLVIYQKTPSIGAPFIGGSPKTTTMTMTMTPAESGGLFLSNYDQAEKTQEELVQMAFAPEQGSARYCYTSEETLALGIPVAPFQHLSNPSMVTSFVALLSRYSGTLLMLETLSKEATHKRKGELSTSVAKKFPVRTSLSSVTTDMGGYPNKGEIEKRMHGRLLASCEAPELMETVVPAVKKHWDRFPTILFGLLSDKNTDKVISWSEKDVHVFHIHDEKKMKTRIIPAYFGVKSDTALVFFRKSLASRGFVSLPPYDGPNKASYCHPMHAFSKNTCTSKLREFQVQERLLFPDKLYNALLDPDSKGILEWASKSSDAGFDILNMKAFIARVLPKRFFFLNDPKIDHLAKFLQSWCFQRVATAEPHRVRYQNPSFRPVMEAHYNRSGQNADNTLYDETDAGSMPSLVNSNKRSKSVVMEKGRNSKSKMKTTHRLNFRKVGSVELFHQLDRALRDKFIARIFSWSPDGLAIHVKNRELFAQVVMPKYFPSKAKKPMQNFVTRLNQYGFSAYPLVNHSSGMYHHPKFTRDSKLWDAPILTKDEDMKNTVSVHTPTCAIITF